jgi:hypothetical protein
LNFVTLSFIPLNLKCVLISDFRFRIQHLLYRYIEELLQQSEDTPEFYLSLAPQFVGKTFGEAWRMLPQVGLYKLNPVDP